MNNLGLDYSIDNEMLNKICVIIKTTNELKTNEYAINNTFKILYKSINPYNKNDLKKINTYRKDNKKNKNNKVNFSYPDYKKIDDIIDSLFNWVEDNKEINPIILAIIFHYSIIKINPFMDGNMKIALTWQQLILSKYNKVFAYISIDDEINNSIEDYYKSINNSLINNNINNFINYNLDIIKTSLDRLFYKKEIITNERINVSRLLKVMDKGTPMSALELMHKLNIKSRDTLRNSYLSIAIKEGKILLTNPDNPTSKNQMYYKI